MLAALVEQMPAEASWTRPGGGFFLWVHLPAGVRAADLLEAARARGVIVSPGADFYAERLPALRGGKKRPPADAPETLRLSFSHAAEGEITRGIAALGEAIAELR